MVDSLLTKIVSSESVEMVRVIHPNFRLESRFDPFDCRPAIYTGSFNARLIASISSRGPDYVIYTKEGGEYSLTREKLFGLCSKRKRAYSDELEKLPLPDFLNRMKILRISDVLVVDDDSESLFELFELISRRTVKAVSFALHLADQQSPEVLVSSLLTFYSKVIKEDEVAQNPRYNLILSRCRKNRGSFFRTLDSFLLYRPGDPRLSLVKLVYGSIDQRA